MRRRPSSLLKSRTEPSSTSWRVAIDAVDIMEAIMAVYSASHSLDMTLVVASLAYLENQRGDVPEADRQALDIAESLAVRTKHAGLMESVVSARRKIKKAKIVVRRRDRINDIVVAKMEGDAAAADAAMKALDDDDAELVKIAQEEAAASKARRPGGVQ
jgi:hypothetical protein